MKLYSIILQTLLIVGLASFSHNGYCQFDNVNSTVLVQNADDLVNASSLSAYGLSTFDLRDYSPNGSPYFEDKWQTGALVLYDDKVVKCPFLYDVQDQEFFIELDGQVYLLPNGIVKTFEIEYDNSEVIKRSFNRITRASDVVYFEELGTFDGISLIRLFDVKVLAPNYNPAIDVGSHKKTYIKQEVLALMDKSSYIELKKPRGRTFKQFKNIELVNALKKGNVDFADSKAILTILNNNYKNL